MNRFAEIVYGRVNYIFETELPQERLSTIFSPKTFWVDVTGTDVQVGWWYNGRNFEPSVATEKNFEEMRAEKLEEVDALTRRQITSGFFSAAKGAVHCYDSDTADQLTFAAMHAASRSPDFATTEPYFGQIPIRAVPAGGANKVVLPHNAVEMQKLMDDLALHIGRCKQTGWELQEQVRAAEKEVDLENIAWSQSAE